MFADAYPASRTPNTSLDSTASMKNAPTDKSCATSAGANGSAMNPQNAAQNARYGASRNRTVSAPAGVLSSFVMSLMPSARDWSSPNGPVRVGPRRSCIRPETLRSAQMNISAEPPMKPTMTPAATAAAKTIAAHAGT